jgi:hypothetical protein
MEVPKTPLFKKLTASAKREVRSAGKGTAQASAPSPSPGYHFEAESIRSAVGTSRLLATYRTPSKQQHAAFAFGASPSSGGGGTSPGQRGRPRSASPPPPSSTTPWKHTLRGSTSGDIARGLSSPPPSIPKQLAVWDISVVTVCRRHEQPFVLFDLVTETPICLACCSQPPHQNHARCDLVEAAKEVRWAVPRHCRSLCVGGGEGGVLGRGSGHGFKRRPSSPSHPAHALAPRRSHHHKHARRRTQFYAPHARPRF